uniref:Uncharacterized protein n=1 Tax=Sipha flava TaxID=143950 RepID=A0A2S2PZF0_9HEMI
MSATFELRGAKNPISPLCRYTILSINYSVRRSHADIFNQIHCKSDDFDKKKKEDFNAYTIFFLSIICDNITISIFDVTNNDQEIHSLFYTYTIHSHAYINHAIKR